MGLGGGGGVGSKVGGRFFLVAAAAVDIRLLMKGALHFAPAAEVGRRLTQTVQRPGGSGGNTAAARTWPRRDLQKTRDMCSLSVIAWLGLLLMCGRRRRRCLCFSRSYVLGNGRDFQAICRQALISAHVGLFTNKGIDPMKKHLNCGDATDCLGITAAFEIIRTHNTRKRLTNKYKNNLNMIMI